ncbi:MAG: xylulokinase [Albidovulum sp.]|nr:xylulokinase [Albidovulum sp.]
MHLGIDLGTSGVKVIVIDDEQRIKAEAISPVSGSISDPPISEQHPAEWITAIERALDQIKSEFPDALGAVEGIGLSGHMHGAVCLDAADHVLRPCIMWNDGRSALECAELDSKADFRGIAGNLVMAGFTAPKLLWMSKREPEIFDRISKVLLPKDYVRLWLSGEFASDMSDASGTLWLDVGRRRWSEELLSACSLDASRMPRLCEGTEATGRIRVAHRQRWGFRKGVLVAGGAGDNAAAACGMGIASDGAFLSLGTSGVVFAPAGSFRPSAGKAVHTFCHALPRTWHQMGVILSAANCIDWLASILGLPVDRLLAMLPDKIERPSNVCFLPYLSGVRTPYNDPAAQAMLTGVTIDTSATDLIQAVLEGVGHALQDCFVALSEAGTEFEEAYAVGGGARSKQWLQIIADITGIRYLVSQKGDYGAAFGAARLAMAASGRADLKTILSKPEVDSVVSPDPSLADAYALSYENFVRRYALDSQARQDATGSGPIL